MFQGRHPLTPVGMLLWDTLPIVWMEPHVSGPASFNSSGHVVVGYPAHSLDGAHVSGPASFNSSGHIAIKDTQLFSAPGPGQWAVRVGLYRKPPCEPSNLSRPLFLLRSKWGKNRFRDLYVCKLWGQRPQKYTCLKTETVFHLRPLEPNKSYYAR
jgi:hypothetical protein